MLCSIPSPKPNSSWLDRLRSSKGFPTSSDLENLEQFLSSNPNPNPNLNPVPIPKPAPKPPITNKDHSLFNLMTDVLSDLFVMGNPPNPPKSSRKQANPRVYNGGGKREVSPSSVNNGVGEGRKRKLKLRKKRGSEGLKDATDLSGFSRTEVTVIDTSLSPDWKVARVLYRKGLVWKVREKKVVRVGRKKRRRVGLAAEKAGSKKESKGTGLLSEQLPLLDKAWLQQPKQ